MPLEVNEIGIRMRVDDTDDEEEDEIARRGRRKAVEDDDCNCGSLDREEIVDDCVRRVLQALKAMRER